MTNKVFEGVFSLVEGIFLFLKVVLDIDQIFKYLKIFNMNIYSDIRSCQIFYTNIFGHSFV